MYNNRLFRASKRFLPFGFIFPTVALLFSSQAAMAENPCPSVPATVLETEPVVNIYSARKEELILPLLERFEASFENFQGSDLQINLITGKADGLLKRLELEGTATPADLFITADAGRLHRAKKANVLQPIPEEIADKVPTHLQDERDHEADTPGHWVGLSQRARPIYYSKKRADPSELTSYEDLADPKFEGRLCIRSSESIYNQSLVASMIAAMDRQTGTPDWAEQETLKWARNVLASQAQNGTANAEAKVLTLAWTRQLVDNFARPPTGGDTDQIRALAAGQCDFALANSYYFGRLIAKNERITNDVGVIWPNQDDRGAHVNVSGAGITAHARHPGNAMCLLEYMLNPESQKWYAEINFEYPVLPDVPWSEVLKDFGTFKADSLEMGNLGEFNSEAVKIMDQAGWR